MAVRHTRGAKKYYATNPGLSALMLVNPSGGDVLADARKLGLISAADERRARRSTKSGVRKPPTTSRSRNRPAGSPTRRKRRRTTQEKPVAKPKRRSTTKRKSARRRPATTKTKSRSRSAAAKKAAATRARKKAARSAAARKAARTRKRNAGRRRTTTKRSARRRRRAASSTRRSTRRNAARKTAARRPAKRKAARRSKRRMGQRTSTKRYGVKSYERRYPKRTKNKRKSKRRRSFFGMRMNRRGGRRFSVRRRSMRMRNTPPMMAAYANNMRRRSRRGSRRRRNPAAVTEFGARLPTFARRGVSLIGGFAATYALDGFVERLAQGRLGEWNGVATSAFLGIATFAMPDKLLRKVPVAGDIVVRNKSDIQMGVVGYGLLQVARMLLPQSWQERFGIARAPAPIVEDVVAPATLEDALSEYVLTGTGTGTGIGEYARGNAGDGGQDEIAAAMGMVHQNKMVAAENLAAHHDRMNEGSALRAAYGDYVREPVAPWLGEYVRLGDYVRMGGGEGAEGISVAALGEFTEIFAGMGLGQDAAESCAALAARHSAAGASKQQAIEAVLSDSRDLIDFPPDPNKPLRDLECIPAGGSQIDQLYSEPLAAGGIFDGGPFCLTG